jgi:hypothetical protein
MSTASVDDVTWPEVFQMLSGVLEDILFHGDIDEDSRFKLANLNLAFKRTQARYGAPRRHPDWESVGWLHIPIRVYKAVIRADIETVPELIERLGGDAIPGVGDKSRQLLLDAIVEWQTDEKLGGAA